MSRSLRQQSRGLQCPQKLIKISLNSLPCRLVFFPLSDHQRRAFDVPLHSASLRVTTITLDIRSPALPAPRAEMEWALQFRACKFSLPCPRLPLPSITHDLTIITTQIANPQHHFTLVRTIKPLSLTALSLGTNIMEVEWGLRPALLWQDIRFLGYLLWRVIS